MSQLVLTMIASEMRPGVVELSAWRPDPGQPELAPVDKPLEPYLGASKINRRVYQCGGVLRRP